MSICLYLFALAGCLSSLVSIHSLKHLTTDLYDQGMRSLPNLYVPVLAGSRYSRLTIWLILNSVANRGVPNSARNQPLNCCICSIFMLHIDWIAFVVTSSILGIGQPFSRTASTRLSLNASVLAKYERSQGDFHLYHRRHH
jgi:hypothetical protein